MFRRREQCSFSVGDIAERISATLIGPPDVIIRGVCSLENPRPAHLTFRRARIPSRDFRLPDAAELGGLIVAEQSAATEGRRAPPLLVHQNPLAAFIAVIHLFFEADSWNEGVHPTAQLHPTVRVGKNTAIGAYSVVGHDSRIGNDVCIHPHVTLYPRVTLGDHVVIHAGAIIREEVTIGAGVTIQAGAVIGSEGFGFAWEQDRGHVVVPQIGTVVIEENARVGANSAVDRATVDETRIGAGTKIDNLVQIGHNVRIGQHALLCGQVGIAGSVTIGDGVVLGGKVGVADHIQIPAGSQVAAGSSIMSQVQGPGQFAGTPAVPIREWRRQVAALSRLPGMIRDIRRRG